MFDKPYLILLNIMTLQIFSLTRNRSKLVMWLSITQCAGFRKYLKDAKHNSLHLARKYVLIFVVGHYLFLKAHSFAQA